MELLIAESAGFSPTALARLQGCLRVTAADCTRNELLAAIVEYDLLWVRLRHRIDKQILDAAPRLRAIATNTTGLNHIDVSEANRRGIAVLSLHGESELLRDVRATAELTLGLMLSLLRSIPAAVRHCARGDWDRYQFRGNDLQGKTVGIVGFGRLGQIVARYLHAFDAIVLATTTADRDEQAESFVEFVSLDDLFARADIVSVHVDLNQTTAGMFNSDAFARMKDGAWFVNTARGEVVDESALLAALESGKLSGAALDVLANEHALPDVERPLVRFARERDNLILTPHMGGYTRQSLEKTEDFLANTLIAWVQANSDQTARVRFPQHTT